MELDITVGEITGTDDHDDDNKKSPAKAAFINAINDITKKRKSKWDCIQRCIDHQEGNVRPRVDADQNLREEAI